MAGRAHATAANGPAAVGGFVVGADALESVANDDDVRETLRERGRGLAARFSWDSTALEHIAIYDELHTS